MPKQVPNHPIFVKNGHFRLSIYSKMQRKRAFMQDFLHKCLTLVRSTGIEDIRRYEKSLGFQGFFTIERQRGRQNFFGKVWYCRSYLTAKTNQIWSGLCFFGILFISLILCHKMQNRHTMYELKSSRKSTRNKKIVAQDKQQWI